MSTDEDRCVECGEVRRLHSSHGDCAGSYPTSKEVAAMPRKLIRTNSCPTCSGSICTTCGHPTPMHVQGSDGERFCTINTAAGCDCKADPRDLTPLIGT